MLHTDSDVWYCSGNWLLQVCNFPLHLHNSELKFSEGILCVLCWSPTTWCSKYLPTFWGCGKGHGKRLKCCCDERYIYIHINKFRVAISIHESFSEVKHEQGLLLTFLQSRGFACCVFLGWLVSLMANLFYHCLEGFFFLSGTGGLEELY